MVWSKLHVLDSLRLPLDGGKVLKDGERLFGDHKTVKGLIGYVGFSAVFAVVWGLLCAQVPALGAHNLLYSHFGNTPLYNLGIGALLGLAWALFELPNSFLKRRLKITPGKPPAGMQKPLFVLLDQADSIFGCVLVFCVVNPLSVGVYFFYVALGTVTHLVLNVLLWLVHLRKEPF
jgi:CDP-diglyceride synthetase